MRQPAFLLSLLFLSAAAAKQPVAPKPADVCTIQGVVVKAGTSEPLSDATVGVRSASRDPQPNNILPDDTVTDDMGRFELKGITPGPYYLWADHDGFLWHFYSQRTADGDPTVLTLSSGQKISDITFQLMPAGVITAHVYDEDGKPVVGAWVAAHGYNCPGAAVGGLAVTQDFGETRFSWLSPGQYIVGVMFPSSYLEKLKTRQGYVPTYYPGVPDADHAVPITVRAGDEFSDIDFHLQPVRMVAVRGHVVNAGCGGKPKVSIIEQNSSNAVVTSESSIDGAGAFELPTVPPGSYYVHAEVREEGKHCAGGQPLEVGDTDINGVTLTITPGVEIKGRLRVEGQLASNLSSFSVRLSAGSINHVHWSSRDALPGDSVKSDGTFLLKNALADEYEIYVGNLPGNYFLKSARLDGVDVLSAGVTVDSKHAPGLLDIVVSPNGASIDGVVSQDHRPFPEATVMLVPDPPYRDENRLFKSGTIDQNGHFVIEGVSPGDYKVFAWEKIEAGACVTSSEFLRPFESRGESVHITEGSHNTVQVD
jgi:hypothetical protein